MASNNHSSAKSNAALSFSEADWDALVELSDAQLSDDPNGAKAYAYVACAHQQLGHKNDAEQFVQKSQEHGCPPETIAHILIAGVHHSLGRALLLNKKIDEAEFHFLEALKVTGLDIKPLQAHDIAVREMIELGLLPDAANKIAHHTDELRSIPRPPSDLSKLAILDSELRLLKHEFTVALTRGQLYKSPTDHTPNSADLKNRSMAQLGQDLWALETCGHKRGGFFVEFGATDGVTLSNTYLLEKEFDWSGLLAEPNPKFLRELKKNRQTTVSDACIGATTGEDVEFIFADVFGGMSKHADADGHGDRRSAYKDAGELTVLTTISLHDFLRKHEAPKQIDYISVDTEGSEYEILKEFPFDEWDVRCWTVEHNFAPIREDIHALFISHGYTRVEAQWDDWYYR